MSSGADLFVICKHCGAEVSPYITECPYCGHRLRKRAPTLPRDRLRRARGLRWRFRRPAASWRRRLAPSLPPPLLSAALVLGAILLWVVTQAGALEVQRVTVNGPLHGSWWRLLTYQFAYQGAGLSTFVYGVVTLTATAVFGAIVEERQGATVMLALFLGAGVGGALAALALYRAPLLSGADSGALALLCAWLAPELVYGRRLRSEADLIGGVAFAAVLLVMPFALTAVSWTAAVVGALCGCLAGAGLGAARSRV